jgi:hypothetical protein
MPLLSSAETRNHYGQEDEKDKKRIAHGSKELTENSYCPDIFLGGDLLLENYGPT